jgi:hypothetical protein
MLTDVPGLEDYDDRKYEKLVMMAREREIKALEKEFERKISEKRQKMK